MNLAKTFRFFSPICSPSPQRRMGSFKKMRRSNVAVNRLNLNFLEMGRWQMVCTSLMFTQLDDFLGKGLQKRN